MPLLLPLQLPFQLIGFSYHPIVISSFSLLLFTNNSIFNLSGKARERKKIEKKTKKRKKRIDKDDKRIRVVR